MRWYCRRRSFCRHQTSWSSWERLARLQHWELRSRRVWQPNWPRTNLQAVQHDLWFHRSILLCRFSRLVVTFILVFSSMISLFYSFKVQFEKCKHKWAPLTAASYHWCFLYQLRSRGRIWQAHCIEHALLRPHYLHRRPLLRLCS